MSLNSRLQSLLGGESADTAIVIADPLVQAEQVQDVAIAEAEADINAVETEIVQTQNDMEVLEERVEELEEKIDGVESMLNGTRSWNPELAQSFYDSARKVISKTFGDAHAPSVKGAECFSDKDNAQLELHAGLLGMKEKAGEIWGHVKQFFINLYNSIINFFRGLFNRFRGIEGKAQALKSRVDAAADDKIKKEIKLGGWNAFIDAEKSKGKPSINAGITAVAKLSVDLGGDAFKLATNTRDTLSSFASSGDQKKSEGANDNNETIQFKEGGIDFTVVIPVSSPKDEAAALGATKASYKVSKDGVKTSGTLSSSQNKAGLSSIVSAVLADAKKAQVDGFSESKLKTKRDAAIASIEVAARGTDADAKETKKKVAITRNGHNAALRVAGVLTRYNGDVLTAQLAYVGAHL